MYININALSVCTYGWTFLQTHFIFQLTPLVIGNNPLTECGMPVSLCGQMEGPIQTTVQTLNSKIE